MTDDHAYDGWYKERNRRMKRTVTLDKTEIDAAIQAYVREKTGFEVGSVRLTYTPPDRPFDQEMWTATASEK